MPQLSALFNQTLGKGATDIDWESVLCDVGFLSYGGLVSGAFALAGGPVGIGLAIGFSLASDIAATIVCNLEN